MVGKFRYTPEISDIIVDLPEKEVNERKDEILNAVRLLSGKDNPINCYCGKQMIKYKEKAN